MCEYCLIAAHTCWWEGQSHAPTSRVLLFACFGAATTTGRNHRIACPFDVNNNIAQGIYFGLLATHKYDWGEPAISY